MRIPGIPYVQGRNSYTDADKKHFGIAIHNTSNDASDEGEASYAKRRTDGVSSHLYVDHNSVTQSLDLDAKAGHAGSGTGNDNAIAVEITGGNGWSRAQWLNNVAWDKLGRALAWVIRNDPDYTGFQVRRATVTEMKTNPKVRAFYGHNDMRMAWGGTTHTDPGPNFPWDRLIQAVNTALAAAADTTPEDEMTDMEKLLLAQARAMAEAALKGTNPVKVPPDLGGSMVNVANVTAVKVAALEAEVKRLQGQATQQQVVDYRQLAQALLAEIAGQATPNG